MLEGWDLLNSNFITVSVPCLLPHLCCCCRCCFVHFSKQPGGVTLFSLFSLLLFCEVGLSVLFICSVFTRNALGKENTQKSILNKLSSIMYLFCHVLCLLIVFSFFGSYFYFRFPATVRCKKPLSSLSASNNGRFFIFCFVRRIIIVVSFTYGD